MFTIHPLTIELLLQHRDSFYETLNNLVESPVLDEHMTTTLFQRMTEQMTQLFVAIDETAGIIWSVSVLIEQKLTKGGVLAWHIEELVTRKWFESSGVGSKLMEAALAHVFDHGCYKIVLDCKEELVGYYEKFEFTRGGVQMKRYL